MYIIQCAVLSICPTNFKPGIHVLACIQTANATVIVLPEIYFSITNISCELNMSRIQTVLLRDDIKTLMFSA